jgi:hypothetical protein
METDFIQEPKSENMDRLRPGIFSFEDIIANGYVYVDKTELIYNLLKPIGGTYFLARPRRFGKSLLLDTIKTIFEGKHDLFRGLAIENLMPKPEWDICRVIFIDMSDIDKEPELLSEDLTLTLNNIANSYGIILKTKKCDSAISELIKALYALPHTAPSGLSDKVDNKYCQRPVLLIDEYDSPLTKYLSQPEKLNKNRETLSEFYLRVKSCSKLLRFGLITGITLFRELSVFSTMNSFLNLTFNPDVSTICGFTESDIRNYYKSILQSSLLTMQKHKKFPLNSTVDDFLNSITEWYDGYSWDGMSKVLNPQSIIEFFNSNEFDNYWYSTAGPNFLETLSFINKFNFLNIFDDNLDINVNTPAPNLSSINPQSALFQCGYLTIDVNDDKDKIIVKGAKKRTYLRVPNKEVKVSIAQEYLIPHLFPDLSDDERDGLCDQYNFFGESFIQHDSLEAANILSSIFSNFSHRAQISGEHFFHSQVKTALAMLGRIIGEYSVARGDIDLVLARYGEKIIYVIEIKYKKSPILPETDVDEGDNNFSNASETQTPSEPMSVPEQLREKYKIKFDDLPIRKNRSEKDQLKVQKALDVTIKEAFDQIHRLEYARAFLYQHKTVFSVAIAVIGRSDVKIEFREVSSSDCIR